MSRSLGQLTIDFIARTSGFEQGMNRAARSAEDSSAKIRKDNKAAADSFNNVWSGAIKHVTALFAVFGAAATFSKMTDSIVGFQDSMLKLQATSRATASDMAKMEKQARSLGATTRYSAQQAADAQNFLAMAGFNTSQVLSATADVIGFASAANVDLAKSADIASNVLGQMRLPVSELSMVMDTMISTAQSSNTSVTQLADALAYVGPVATAAGINIHEMSAAIGVLGDAGIQGGRAGTGLQGVIQNLINVTPKAEKVLASYGLSIKDVDVTTHGLTEVLERLDKANLSAGDSLAIFGQVAAASALNLSAASGRVKELTEANEEAAGRTKEVASLLDSGLSAAFAAVSSAIEEMMLRIGESGLTKAMQVLAVTTAGVINEFNGLLPEFAEASGLSVEFEGRIKILATTVKALGIGLGALALTAIPAVVAAIKTMTLAIMANPFGLLAVGAASVAAYFMAIRDDIDKFNQEIDAMGGAWIVYSEIFKGFWGGVLDFLRPIFGGIFDWFGDVWDRAVEATGGMELSFDSAFGAIADGLDSLYSFFIGWVASVTSLIETLGHNIRAIFKFAIDTIKEDFSEMVGKLSEYLGKLGLGFEYTPFVKSSDTADIIEFGKAAKEAFKEASDAADLGMRASYESAKAVSKLRREYEELTDANDVYWNGLKDTTTAATKLTEVTESGGETITAAGKAAKKAAEEMSAAIKALVDQLFPAQKAADDLAKNTKTLDEALKRGVITTAQHAKGLDDLKKRYNDLLAANIPHLKTINDQIEATKSNVKSLTDQIRAYGETEVSLAKKSLAETNARLATLETIRATQLSTGASKEYIKQIDLEIAKLKELRNAQEHQTGLLDTKATQDGYQKMADDAVAMNSEIGDTLTDALMRAFESGQSFAEAMKSTAMNMFKTMILKPVLQPIVSGFSSALGMGPSGAQVGGGGLGGFSPLTGFAGSMSGAVQTIGGQLASMGGSFGDFGANIVMNADKIGGALDKLGAGFSYATSVFQMTQGKWGAGIGGAAGQFLGGPVGSFIGSQLGGMLDKAFKGETRSGGGFGYNVGEASAYFGGGPSGGYGGQQTIDTMTQLLKSQAGLINSVLAGVGSNAFAGHVAGAFESSDKGRGGTYSGGVINIEGKEVKFGTDSKGQGYGGKSGSTEEMFNNMAKDFAYSALEAWKVASDQMPKIIGEQLENIDIRGLSVENAEALVTDIQNIVMSVGALQEALSGLPFPYLQSLTFDLSASLLQAAGGFDALMGGLESFYQGFYSEQERFDIAAKKLNESVSDLGFELPSTREDFRNLVDSLDATDKSTHTAIAGLLGLSGAADQFYTEIERQYEQAVKAAQDAARDHEREMDSIAKEEQKTRDTYIKDIKDFANNLKKSAEDIIKTFDGIAANISSSFASLRERITLDIMKDDEERYAYYKKQFDSLSKEIDFTTDADRLNEIVREMNQIAGTAYGLLDEDVRKGGKGQEYLATIAENERRSLEKAEQLRKETASEELRKRREDAAQIAQELASILDAAGDNLNQAAANSANWASNVEATLATVAAALNRLSEREIQARW